VKKEIQISRKKLASILRISAIVILAILSVILFTSSPALRSFVKARFQGQASTPALTDQLDGKAASAALTAFYTLDYTEPEDQWRARVCALATPDGCQLIQALFAPSVRKVVEANQVKTGCTVQPVAMVEENTPQEQNGATRIWLLTVSLDHPWPGTNQEFTVYAEVAQVNGAWLLNRILFEQEAARFQTPTVTP
jgi:hypothetical protein